jgi:hypothetical protein
MKRTIRLLGACVAVAAICSGCPHPIWLPDRNLKSEVVRGDVIGKWTLTTNSLGLLARDGFDAGAHSIYMIDFRASGTVDYTCRVA